MIIIINFSVDKTNEVCNNTIKLVATNKYSNKLTRVEYLDLNGKTKRYKKIKRKRIKQIRK